VHRQIESTLNHLKMDYLDSVVIHWPICLDKHDGDHAKARKAAWQALEGVVATGVVRYLGCSNWTISHLEVRIHPILNQFQP